jgi:sec-independent protein translocase protein TatB
MFEIAWSELFIVLVVAIIVVGPKELPGMLRALGRMLGKLRRQADDFRRQFDESMKDVGGEDLQRELNELRRHNPLNDIRNNIEDAAREVSKPVLPTPDAYVNKPEEPPLAHENYAEPGVSAAPPPPAIPAPAEGGDAAPTPLPAPAAEPAPVKETAAAKEPAVTPGHEPVINGQHRPLS